MQCPGHHACGHLRVVTEQRVRQKQQDSVGTLCLGLAVNGEHGAEFQDRSRDHTRLLGAGSAEPASSSLLRLELEGVELRARWEAGAPGSGRG